MLCTSVAPDDQVADVRLPHGQSILLLHSMFEQYVEQLLVLLWLQFFNVVDMHGQIQVGPP